MNKGCFKKGHKSWNKGKRYHVDRSHVITPSGKDSPLWKGGFSHTTQGYITIHIGTGVIRQQLYHHYLMEKKLRRKLKKTEHIHHINGDRIDNRIENLQLLSDTIHNGLHIREHPELHYHFPKGQKPSKHKHGCICNRCKNSFWKT